MFDKLFPAFLLSLALVLPHTSAMAGNTPPKGSSQDEESETRGVHPKFRVMKLYINSFEDYTEQVLSFLETIEATCSTEYSSLIDSIKEQTKSARGHVDFARSIQDSLFALNNGEISSTKLLHDWLVLRFTVLWCRYDTVSEKPNITRTSDLRNFLGLADPNCPSKFIPTVEVAKFIGTVITKSSNDQFELFNHLIAALYQITPKQDLTPQVKALISASQSLWPLLLGESAESLDMDSSLRDYEYYINCIKRLVPQRITFMNHIQTPGMILVTAYEAGLPTSKLPKPEWLYGALKEKSFPVLSDPSPTKLKKKRKKKKKKNHPTEAPTQAIVPSLPAGEESSVHQEATINVPSDIEEEDYQDGLLISPSLGDQIEPRTPPLLARGNRLFHEQRTQVFSMDLKRQFARALSTKNRKLLETIFDTSLNGQGFCFRELKSLWKKLNGPGSVHFTGRGSSHCVLKWKPDGENWIVVGSTFAHGPNHTYTPKTVRYIRDAFSALGYPWDEESVSQEQPTEVPKQS